MIYNPLDKFYKSHTGAVPCGEEITFRVKTFDSVCFVYKKDNGQENYIPCEKYDGYSEIKTSFNCGLYFYTFKIGNSFVGLNDEYVGELTNFPKWFQLTVFDREFNTPNYIKGGIIYQIFPDRFYGEKLLGNKKGIIIHDNKKDIPFYKPNENGQVLNNDFYGGNLDGIRQKIQYLKSLGVSVIYLNPIFKSSSNHRYDTGDYFAIDETLGNENDLKLLIEDCDKAGIKVILDGVFNHTGDDSIYFNKYGNYDGLGAYQSKESPYYKWYDFTSYPNEYRSWWGVKILPAIKKDEKSFFEYIAGENGVIEHYQKLGIGGWRLDVVDELHPDFVKKIRERVKSIDDNAIVIGEVWEDASNKVSYGIRREYFLGKELDSVMNYPLKDGIISFVKGEKSNLLKVINEQIDHYPKCVLDSLMNILSTHDTYRLLSALDYGNFNPNDKDSMAEYRIPQENMESVVNRLKSASLLQYTLFGVPSLYYGDEVGMQGLKDPFNRGYFPWGEENFDILSWYRLLGKIRNERKEFIDGEFKSLYFGNGLFIYKRIKEDSEVLVCVNCGNRDFSLNFSGKLLNLLDNKEYKDNVEVGKNFLGIMVNDKK